MTIYVEYVIVDNMVINSLLLVLTKNLLHLKTSKFKLLSSATLGTIVALLSPLLPNIVNLLLKIPLATLMLIVAFKFSTFKKLLIAFLTFLCSTFLFGGAVIGIMELFGIKFSLGGSIEYQYDIPVGFVVLVAVLMFVCIKNVAKYVLNKNTHSKLLFEAQIECNGNTIKIPAFLDSGNKILVDGKPVCIINYKTFNSLYPNIKLTDILLKNKLEIKNAKYIEIQSIGSQTQKLLSFEADSIQINSKKTENIRLALSLVDFSKKTESDIIISNEILGDDYETSKN